LIIDANNPRQSQVEQKKIDPMAEAKYAANYNLGLAEQINEAFAEQDRSIFSSSPIFAWRADRTSSRTRAEISA
jgi:hypothetical protein